MKRKNKPHAKLDTRYWVLAFAQNKLNRPEPDWDAPLQIPDKVRSHLTQSILEFQLGDGGGPASLIAFNASRFREETPEIREVVDLWFDEEKEHSRLLGEMAKRLGAAPISGHWSFSLFCLFRRCLGVGFELQILTVTELVSTSYYTLLRKYTNDPALLGVCSLILRDEGGHLRFQNDRLAARGRRSSQRIWAAQFWVCALFAGTVLWISHGRCIRGLGGSTREFYANIKSQVSKFLQKLDCKPQEHSASEGQANPSDLSAKTPSIETSRH
jgi:hypothetical protein